MQDTSFVSGQAVQLSALQVQGADTFEDTPAAVGFVKPERFVGPEVAAAFLDVTRHRLLCMARSGEIPGHPLGRGSRRQWRFRLSELADALQQNTLTSSQSGRENPVSESPATPSKKGHQWRSH